MNGVQELAAETWTRHGVPDWWVCRATLPNGRRCMRPAGWRTRSGDRRCPACQNRLNHTDPRPTSEPEDA